MPDIKDINQKKNPFFSKRELFFSRELEFETFDMWSLLVPPWGLHVFFFLRVFNTTHDARRINIIFDGWLYFCFTPFEQHFIFTISRLSDIAKRHEGDPSTSLHIIVKQHVPLSSYLHGFYPIFDSNHFQNSRHAFTAATVLY